MRWLRRPIRRFLALEKPLRTGLKWRAILSRTSAARRRRARRNRFESGGEIKDGVIEPAASPVITCQCIRVPVLNGHTAAVFVKFRKQPTKEQLIEKLVNFKGVPQELNLPSAPKQFIQYLEEDNRPQVSLDVDYENGMGVSVGRIREDSVYDWKFVGLSHNTVRGAARRCRTLRRASQSAGVYHKRNKQTGKGLSSLTVPFQSVSSAMQKERNTDGQGL